MFFFLLSIRWCWWYLVNSVVHTQMMWHFLGSQFIRSNFFLHTIHIWHHNTSEIYYSYTHKERLHTVKVKAFIASWICVYFFWSCFECVSIDFIRITFWTVLTIKFSRQRKIEIATVITQTSRSQTEILCNKKPPTPMLMKKHPTAILLLYQNQDFFSQNYRLKLLLAEIH